MPARNTQWVLGGQQWAGGQQLGATWGQQGGGGGQLDGQPAGQAGGQEGGSNLPV